MPFERFVEEARTAVAGAIDEAPALGHRRVGTEHLLISLASDPAAPAGAALATLGITSKHVLLGIVLDGGDAAEILAGLDAPADRVITALTGAPQE